MWRWPVHLHGIGKRYRGSIRTI